MEGPIQNIYLQSLYWPDVLMPLEKNQNDVTILNLFYKIAQQFILLFIIFLALSLLCSSFKNTVLSPKLLNILFPILSEYYMNIFSKRKQKYQLA